MQRSNPTNKSECDEKINVQMKDEANSSNTTTPRRISSPGTGTTTPDTTNRRQINDNRTPAPPVGTPGTGMPMDRGTPPNSGTPMNRGTTPPAGTPMNRGITPPAGSPMNRRTTPGTGTPMNGTMPRTPGTPMNGTMPRTPGTPMNGTMPMTPGTPMNGTMPMSSGTPMNGTMPGNTPFNTPMGVPLYPLYGYDNCEDMDRDLDYFKRLYPNIARRIQSEIDDECDKLEYDGSIMFDEYPDKVSLDRIIDRIIDRIRDMDDMPRVEAYSFYSAPGRRQNIVRDLVSIILLNEFLNRRRRYRRRRRWF
jgi:hypothetical protein